MTPDMECPKCANEMERAEYDPSVGLCGRGWICPNCEEFVEDDDDFYGEWE